MEKQNVVAETERAVLAVLLTDPGAIFQVSEILPDSSYFLSAAHQRAYHAILTLALEKQVPNAYTVADRAALPLADLQKIAGEFSPKLSAEVLYLAGLVRKHGEHRQDVVALEAIRKTFDKPTEDRAGRILTAAGRLMERLDVPQAADPSVAAVMERFDEDLAQIEGRDLIGVDTGLAWVNEKTGGFVPGHIWSICAPYKGRKTTIMRNLVINACRAGASVSIFALEGWQTGTVAGLLAMLATDHLLAEGHEEDCILGDTYLWRGRRSVNQKRAIDYARTELESFRLRIYDSRDGVYDPRQLAAVARRDRILYGTDVIAVDYLQLLGNPDRPLFENMRAASTHLQRLAATEGFTAVLLSQLNESTIWRDDEDDQDGNGNGHYSPGVKGGGDLVQASDYLFIAKYRGSRTPDQVSLILKHARFAAPGEMVYTINPESGWITGESTRL